jgi:CDP-diacylglycerol---glycerol-3-phosphate 3-phosphatidyltransferase
VASLNIPNTISVGRVGLAMITLALLWIPEPRETLLWSAFVLTAIVIWADGLDGYFARKLKQATKFGAMLDIAGDRVVEMAYLIAYAALGWIPVWIPLLFLVRGTFVDVVRSFASEQGFTAFGEKTMQQSALGKFLVASNFSRGSYAVAKAAAFCLLIAAHTKLGSGYYIPEAATFFLYFSVVFCIIRGLPVLVEGKSLITTQ